MKKNFKNKKGFTLIELLVVITIIGILATSGVGIYTTQMQGARDSVRVNNMKLIEESLHQYYSDKGAYPAVEAVTGHTAMVAMFADDTTKTPTTSATAVNMINAISIYNSNYPKDPKAGVSACYSDDATTSGANCVAHYNVAADNFSLPLSRFKISTRLEKKTNVETEGIAQKDYTGENHIKGRLEQFAGAGGGKLTQGTYRIQ